MSLKEFQALEKDKKKKIHGILVLNIENSTSNQIVTYYLFAFIFIFFRATPAVYGSCQDRG